MINISTSKQLGIILPNTNKALAKVLSTVTPQELEVITKGKDLKSVMSTILKQTASASDKNLLELVKNNPTLKNLGEVSTTIKDLLNSIKSDKEPLPMEKVLKNFLTDIKDLKNHELKQKFENSGIFLESRIKDVKNPQVELKNALISLTKTLYNDNNAHNRSIVSEAKTLLNTEVLKSASTTNIENKTNDKPKQLQQLASSIDALISKIKTSLKGSDTIHNPPLAKALEKLEHQFEIKTTTPAQLKDAVMLNSLDELKNQIQAKNTLEIKTLSPENFKLSAIKESLEQVFVHVNKSFTMESKGILESLEKIFQSLKTVEQTTTTVESSIKKLLEQGTPQDILKLSDRIKDVILKADPIFSKDTNLILNKLESLSSAQKLNPQNNVKEIISNDLKAILLQTADEITKSTHPNQSEVLKQIDKLSLQIDHYQLLSHLSNGTSMYLPFSWDMMEEGNITMKKDDEEKFYCDIDLKLKEYGDLNLKLTLYDKNQLNLHIYSSSDKFKELVKENIPSLRSSLIEAQITPREIRVFEPKQHVNTSPYQKQEDNIYMGFEVKG